MSEQDFAVAIEALRREILKRVGKGPNMEDIYQDVACRAFKKCSHFANEDDLAAYLYAAIVRQSRREYARATQRQRALKRVVNTLTEEERTTWLPVEEKIALEEAVADLSPELRSAVLAVLVTGETYRESPLPHSTVARAVERVRQKMLQK